MQQDIVDAKKCASEKREELQRSHKSMIKKLQDAGKNQHVQPEVVEAEVEKDRHCTQHLCEQDESKIEDSDSHDDHTHVDNSYDDAHERKDSSEHSSNSSTSDPYGAGLLGISSLLEEDAQNSSRDNGSDQDTVEQSGHTRANNERLDLTRIKSTFTSHLEGKLENVM